MKIAKTLSFLIFSIFLVSAVSAMTTYADWIDGSQSATINNGESINFNVDFFSMNTPMNVKAELLDSQSNVIHTFITQSVTNREYSATYILSRAIYGSAGSFSVVVSGTDAYQSDSSEITLRVNPFVSTDTTVPVITLLGANPQNVIQGTAYTELGATATDNVDGDITSRITSWSTVDTAVIGTYTVTYTVSDIAGNQATATRTVNVVAQGSDVTAPVITILGANPQNIVQGTAYTELGATALDNVNGNVTPGIVISGVVNTAVIGAYTITYTVSDVAGNTATATRTVNVVAQGSDVTAPVITIISPTDGSDYDSRITSLQVQITDANLQNSWFRKNGGAIINFAALSGEIKTINTYSLEGTNTWTVYAIDSFGNQASSSITFTVNSGSNRGVQSIGNAVAEPVKETKKSTVPIATANQTNKLFNSNVPSVLYIIISIISVGIIILSTMLIINLRNR